MERHAAGRCVSLRELGKGKLRAVIQDVLGDPGYRDAMGKLRGFQSARNGPSEAARHFQFGCLYSRGLDRN